MTYEVVLVYYTYHNIPCESSQWTLVIWHHTLAHDRPSFVPQSCDPVDAS